MEHNPILKNPLSLDSEIPLYSQLMGIIKRSISSGAAAVHKSQSCGRMPRRLSRTQPPTAQVSNPACSRRSIARAWQKFSRTHFLRVR